MPSLPGTALCNELSRYYLVRLVSLDLDRLDRNVWMVRLFLLLLEVGFFVESSGSDVDAVLKRDKIQVSPQIRESCREST